MSSKKTKEQKREIRSNRAAALSYQLAKTLQTTSKQLLWLFSINGVLWIWCSYILAFMGRDQIAESLSSNVCTIVIGQMGFYLVTKTVENVFQYNDIFAKRNLNTNSTTSVTSSPEEVITPEVVVPNVPEAPIVMPTPIIPVPVVNPITDNSNMEVMNNVQTDDGATISGAEQESDSFDSAALD